MYEQKLGELYKNSGIVRGFHFLLGPEYKLQYEDETQPKVGEWIPATMSNGFYYPVGIWNRVRVPVAIPVLCHYGMHASKNVLDAFGYVQSSWDLKLCSVLVFGNIVEGHDKFVGTHRKIVSERIVPREMKKTIDDLCRAINKAENIKFKISEWAARNGEVGAFDNISYHDEVNAAATEWIETGDSEKFISVLSDLSKKILSVEGVLESAKLARNKRLKRERDKRYRMNKKNLQPS